MRTFALVALLLAALCGTPAQAFDAEDSTAMVGGVVRDAIRPAHQAFAAKARALAADVQPLCEEPSQQGLAAARDAFAGTVAAWSRAEIVRFGPVTGENRLERILYWPDRRGTGLRQVQDILARKDATATDPAALAGKSVAVQGLGAMEFLLFGSGSDLLGAAGDAFRCSYAKAVAENVAALAVGLDEAWASEAEGSPSWLWSHPGADNPLYRTPDEAAAEIVDILVHGLELVRDVRLGGFLAEAAAEDRPKQALYWRSGETVASIRANMDALRAVFQASGLRDRLSADHAWLGDSILFEFSNADRALGQADGAVADVLADPQRRARLAYARLVTSSLTDLIGRQLTAEFGLTTGFSSLDGD